MDRLYIQNLVIPCIIGTRPRERIHRQPVRVHIAMECDLSRAGKTDHLSDTVNYHRLAERLIATASQSRFYLLERLAEEMARVCLEEARVEGVTVRVEKPRALRNARAAAVEIYRAASQKARAATRRHTPRRAGS